MKSYFRLSLGAALLVGLAIVGPAKPAAQEITREQADAILKELRQIRQLLEQLVRANSSLNPPAPAQPVRVKLSVGKSYSLGREDAPLTLVEFTDYQCGYCQRFHLSTFEQLKKSYIDTGKLRFVSRDLPLQIHSRALPAAHGARCAGEQGKFWEMRHLLLANANKLVPEAILNYGRQLQLDMDAYQSCIASKKYEDAIQKDVAEANDLGITGTPTFVLGRTAQQNFEGIKIVGAQPVAVFDARIKELLPPIK